MKTANIFLIILILLNIYIIYNIISSTDNADLYKKGIQKIEIKMQQINDTLTNRLEKLKIIEKKSTLIKNNYYKILNETDTINSDSILIYNIRRQLTSLGQARLDSL